MRNEYKIIFGLLLSATLFACTDGGHDGNPNGAICYENGDCASNNCVSGVCLDKTGKSGGIANGLACSFNADCASNNCVNKVCRVSTWKEQGTKTPNGEACTSNDECESGNCFEGKVCRASTWKDPGTKTPNGEACTSNDECESGNCFEGKVCRTKSWTGEGTKGVLGYPCTLNSECQSKVCVNNVCTDHGSGKLSNNTSGIGSAADGAACTKNAQCESGLCYNGKCSNDCQIVGCVESYYVCRSNKCIPVETVGGECTENSDCGLGHFCCNGFCGANKCEVGIICSYQTSCNGYCNNSNYCSCNETAECGNNMYCDYDSSWGQICYPKKQLNSECSEDYECIDGLYCNGYKCVQKLENDDVCFRVGHCKSGYCENTDGKPCASYDSCYCKPPLDNGKTCKYDSNCKSNYCKPSTSTCEDRW